MGRVLFGKGLMAPEVGAKKCARYV
jgi:hypothetical protein